MQSGREYPQVGVKGFGKGLFVRETLNATQTTYKTFNCLYTGAVVLSQVKAWEGAVAVCASGLAGRYVSPEYRTFRCIPDQAIPEYLEALFATHWFWSKVQAVTRGIGSRRERTRPNEFLSIRLPMPTVAQQRKAITIFEKFRKIELLQAKTVDELDALLPSILNKIFKYKS